MPRKEILDRIQKYIQPFRSASQRARAFSCRTMIPATPAHFEDYLTRQGIIILKFFLQVSREEQKKRFMKGLETPEKNWKFAILSRASRPQAAAG